MAPERHEFAAVDVMPLGQPLKFEFSGKVAQNRFLKAAMNEQLSSWDPKSPPAQGFPSKGMANVYRKWGEGNFGVILTGNIVTEYDQVPTRACAVISRNDGFSGERFEAFREIATEAKKHGSLIIGQICHPGRQCGSDIQPDPVSASDVQMKNNVMGMHANKPHPASLEEIEDIIDGFAYAAEYLERAGFDGVEIHGAHGYLLAQFLSQSTNLRTDRYGGSLRNRARLTLEVAEAIRLRTSPDFIMGIKLNSVEFQDKGFTQEEAKQLCAMLEENKFDLVELSGGTFEDMGFEHKKESTKHREAFFLEFADEITPALSKTKSYITGGFKTAAAMVRALDTVDGVGLGRAACQEPRLPKAILEGKVQAVIKQRPNDQHTALATIVAGSQIRQTSKDQEPFDMSSEENEKAFMKAMNAWMERLTHDPEMLHSGYVDVTF